MSLLDIPLGDQYDLGSLTEDSVDANPAKQFKNWFEHAQKAGIHIPEAVNLATAELPSGRVSNRMVLMKGLSDHGEINIYSNWETSRKANDLLTNPNISLTFYWKELERQVRVEGTATLMNAEDSQPYYDTRPRGSRIGAWASQQSRPVANRETLEHQVEAIEKKFEGQDHIPIPPFWGGIRIVPTHWEFWQGRRSRVHDRIVYDLKDGKWERQRLSP